MLDFSGECNASCKEWLSPSGGIFSGKHGRAMSGLTSTVDVYDMIVLLVAQNSFFPRSSCQILKSEAQSRFNGVELRCNVASDNHSIITFSANKIKIFHFFVCL